MLLVVLAAGAALARVPIAIVLATLALSLVPTPLAAAGVLIVAAVSIVRHKRVRAESGPSEGDILRQISARVAAGANIRSAITDPSNTAIPSRAQRLASLGQPMTDVGDALTQVFPVNGAAFRAICSFSEHTGAAISSALTVLAERADEAADLARQRRVSLAQVKLSATVVGLVPIAISVALVVLRGVPEPGGAVIVIPMVVGVALQIVGTAVVFRVASRAS